MKVVSERTQAEVERERATADLSWALRGLAANLLRVIRGAGKAYFIPEQTVEVIKALQAYHAIVGMYPSDYEMSEILHLGQERPSTDFSDEEWSRWHAEKTIIRGALQITASRLLQQSTQAAMGNSEMSDGVNSLERARQQMRAKYQASKVQTDKPVRRPRRQINKP